MTTANRLKKTGGFSMVAIMMLITLVAIIAAIAFPVLNKTVEKARMTKDQAHVRQILMACKLYALDHEGVFPTVDESGTRFTTSTAAFNELMVKIDLDTEELFYVEGNYMKPRGPNMDGVLTAEENCYSYVTGQTDATSARSPLVADEMESPGVYGYTHPWLNQGKAVVGFVGGEAKIMELSERDAGATVLGPPGSGIDDIFQQAQVDDEGRITGGFLAVDRSNILQP